MYINCNILLEFIGIIFKISQRVAKMFDIMVKQ